MADNSTGQKQWELMLPRLTELAATDRMVMRGRTIR